MTAPPTTDRAAALAAMDRTDVLAALDRAGGAANAQWLRDATPHLSWDQPGSPGWSAMSTLQAERAVDEYMPLKGFKTLYVLTEKGRTLLPKQPTIVTAAEYVALDDRAREAAITDACVAGDRVRRRVAALYAAEVAIEVRKDFPTAAAIHYATDLDVDGERSVTVIDVLDTDGGLLWFEDGGDMEVDYNDDSTVRDLIGSVAEWDDEYDGTGVELIFPAA